MQGITYQDFIKYRSPYVDPDGLDSIPDDGMCPACGEVTKLIWDTLSTDPHYEEITSIKCTKCKWEI